MTDSKTGRYVWMPLDWQAVPKEPTQEMCVSAYLRKYMGADGLSASITARMAYEIFKGMTAAAPSLPEAPVDPNAEIESLKEQIGKLYRVSNEVAVLRNALRKLDEMILAWARDQGFPPENSACLRVVRAALDAPTFSPPQPKLPSEEEIARVIYDEDAGEMFNRISQTAALRFARAVLALIAPPPPHPWTANENTVPHHGSYPFAGTTSA